MNVNIYKIYFIVNVDGVEVHSVENTDARTFQDVNVFNGGFNLQPSEASFRNFTWQNNGGEIILF